MDKFSLFTILILFTNSIFSQDSSVYKCNIALLKNCQQMRVDSTINVSHDYKKMLRRDKKVLNFLNAYNRDSLSTNELFSLLKKRRKVTESNQMRSDTSWYLYVIDERGLTRLMIYVWIKDNKLVKRFYQLEVNNTYKNSFNQPMDYHYMVFKFLTFCLPRRFSCYRFDREW